MNDDEASAWLWDQWQQVLEGADLSVDADVDRLGNSPVTSIRYAVFAQVLGKIANPVRDILCLQRGAPLAGAWNARSFCEKVGVPWVSANHNVLGTSTSPYLSKPLRRPMLTADMPNVRDKQQWAMLVAFLSSLQTASQRELDTAFRMLLTSAVKRMSRHEFAYPIPHRISLAAVQSIVSDFLKSQSGGLRALVVTAALMRTIGAAFELFSRVEIQGINEPDTAKGVPGDIMCYDGDGRLALVVEVKDRALSLADVRDATRKVRQSWEAVTDLLFAARGPIARDRDAIDESLASAWATGLNIHYLEIDLMIRVVFSLQSEDWRPRFLGWVCRELDSTGEHRHRRVWYSLLSRVATV